MFVVEEHLAEIEEICQDLRVQWLDLAGSAVRDDFDPERSDVDVLVQFKGNDHLFDRYFALKARLEESLGRKVDVIQPRAVKNPYVWQTLERDRRRIYGT